MTRRKITTATQAWQEIEICCQTLCHKQTVIDYITDLEDELTNARRQINDLRNELEYLRGNNQ